MDFYKIMGIFILICGIITLYDGITVLHFRYLHLFAGSLSTLLGILLITKKGVFKK